MRGHDTRGAFAGQVELGDGRLTRVVQYADAKIEDGRSLSWVWRGALARASDGTLGARVDLARRGCALLIERLDASRAKARA